MATGSTIPAVLAAVRDGLALVVPAGTEVRWGRPPDALVPRHAVYLGDVSLTSRIPTIKAGRKQREERYTFDVVVWEAPPRGTAEAAMTQALATYDLLDDLLADDPTLANLDGLVSATISDADMTSSQTNEGPIVVLVATVAVHARLV